MAQQKPEKKDPPKPKPQDKTVPYRKSDMTPRRGVGYVTR